jgi:hypothetical protein
MDPWKKLICFSPAMAVAGASCDPPDDVDLIIGVDELDRSQDYVKFAA